MGQLLSAIPLFSESDGFVGCEDGEEQWAQEELHKVCLATGLESLQKHQEHVAKLVASLEEKLNSREAEGDVHVSEEELSRALTKIDKQISGVRTEIQTQKGVLDKQWGALVAECGHDTAEGLRELEADLEAQVQELHAVEPQNYVPIAHLR